MREAQDPFVEIVRRAGRDHQVVCPSDVVIQWAKRREADPDAATLARSTLYRRLRAAGHEPRHRGVWLPADLRAEAVRDAQAAHRAVGDPMAFTGQWVLWATKVVGTAPTHPTLLVPASRTLTVSGFRLLRTRTFEQVATRRIHGVPAAVVPRGIADYASEGASLRAVTSAIVEADRLRRCSLDDVRCELDRRQRFPGRATLARACGQLAEELSHSAVEQRGRRRLRRLEPAFTSRPYKVLDGTRLVAEVDAALVPLAYAVEIDGPPHLWPERQIADRRRDRSLAGLGWTVDRFWWFEVDESLDEIVQRVRRQLTALGWRPTGT